MPMREFGCTSCGATKELYHPSLDPMAVPPPLCHDCATFMDVLFSVPNLDTSATFHPFTWRDPDSGKHIRIENLHMLRAIEHASLESGRNTRFDAYSAEPSNPDSIDGFGPEYWDGNPTSTSGKAFSKPSPKLPTMKA